MKLVITDKTKKELFVAILQTIKNCSSTVNAFFTANSLQIQGMDPSHVCLFETILLSNWFNEYMFNPSDTANICCNSGLLHTILSKHDGSSITIEYEGEPETLNISLEATKTSDFNKYFKMPLINFDYELMFIPESEYAADFSICSKKICDITLQMSPFGDDVTITCGEESISLKTDGISGDMLVTVSTDDLTEYSIGGDGVELTYSLNYIAKMCLTNKLTSEVTFSLHPELPMRMLYDLHNGSYVKFYLAPKCSDN